MCMCVLLIHIFSLAVLYINNSKIYISLNFSSCVYLAPDDSSRSFYVKMCVFVNINLLFSTKVYYLQNVFFFSVFHNFFMK